MALLLHARRAAALALCCCWATALSSATATAADAAVAPPPPLPPRTETNLHLHVLTDEVGPGTLNARCLDGSPMAYWIRPASAAENKSKFVVYFQGGGKLTRSMMHASSRAQLYHSLSLLVPVVGRYCCCRRRRCRRRRRCCCCLCSLLLHCTLPGGH